MEEKNLKLLTIEEVRELFKIKESKIRKAILKKEIPYIKLGGLIRFREADLLEFIKESTVLCKSSTATSNQ